MNLLKQGLRFLIATGSVLGFLVGWVLLAHAGKPAPESVPAVDAAPAPLPALPPIPDLGNAPSQFPQLQALPALPQPLVSLPRLRTRGS
jgi:hypothetical protein